MRKLINGIILFTLLFTYGCSNHLKKKNKVSQNIEKENPLFSENIRSTEALSPSEEKLAFKLPEGFEIELYASEPEIGKPINMCFDAKGRLWVTQSFEYPFAAEQKKGKDRISILEDKNGDGKADSFTHFDDTLNIPIGILPLNDGALGFSIPNVYRFTDTDHNGIADKSKILLGPFGYRDTHGMVNNLVRGFDGWVHANHGFANTSVVAGTDGDSIKMESGNTFRFRLDGSRVEQTTFGRINPFGLTYDELGYLYSSDCHSSPIYQLIPGADYPQFGKKDEGIGFAPAMRPVGKESTALAGLAYYTGNKFPKEYKRNFFLGDVVTCKIYRNSVEYKGTSPVAKAQPDFLTSKDPWFRPVDIKMGPDGALYVADFYNKIIGHYEVALDNPGRDRIKGRIWRITYKGTKNNSASNTIKDWASASVTDLIEGLSNNDLSIRMTVADQLVDRFPKESAVLIQSMLTSGKANEKQFAHGLWILHRLGALDNTLIGKGADHTSTLVRVHTLRILKETKANASYNKIIIKAIGDKDPNVQRVALEALTKYPDIESVKIILSFQPKIPVYDTHLLYTSRLVLRNILRNDRLMAEVAARKWNANDIKALTDVTDGVYSQYSGLFLFNILSEIASSSSKEVFFETLEHIAIYLPQKKIDDLVAFIINDSSIPTSAQYRIFNIIENGMSQRGAKASPKMIQWAENIAREIFAIDREKSWTYKVSDNKILSQNSIATYNGYYTPVIGSDNFDFKGIIKSPGFIIPDSMYFVVFSAVKYEANEKGQASNNLVRLRLRDNNKVIAQEKILFGDTTSYPSWKFPSYKGKPGYIEIVCVSPSYIKIGDFHPSVVNIPSDAEIGGLQKFAIEVTGNYQMKNFESQVQKIFSDNTYDYNMRHTAAYTLLQLNIEKNIEEISATIKVDTLPLSYRKNLINILGKFPLTSTQKTLEGLLKNVSGDLQEEIIKSLAASSEGKNIILKKVREGNIYSRILLEPKVEERMLLDINEKQLKEFKELTSNLTPINDERENLIQERIKKFHPSDALIEPGQMVFLQNCSPCHQIKNMGGMIGPQLNGIGNWGASSLAVKILDPNRNISEAFRNYTIKLKNGNVLTGLYRREEGETIVFANTAGEEFSVAKKNILEKKASKYTLMPDHFGKLIPEEDFYKLLSYLVTIK